MPLSKAEKLVADIEMLQEDKNAINVLIDEKLAELAELLF